MNSASLRQAKLRAATNIALMLLMLWLFPPMSLAGELSEIHDGPQLGFTLPGLSGQQRSLDEFSGRVVLVNFWASCCKPCIEELLGIHRLIETMRERPFAVIGVNVAEPMLQVRTTVRRLEMKFPVLLDTDSRAFKGWCATALPTAYVLVRSGRVRYIGRGPLDWDRVGIVEMLNQLMEQPPPQE